MPKTKAVPKRWAGESWGYRVRPAFTLIELLVVIAIIGVLVALLLPAVQAARESGRRAQCSNQIRHLGLALHGFHDANKMLPPGALDASYNSSREGFTRFQIATNLLHGWPVFALPHLEQQSLAEAYRFDRDWRSTENQRVRETLLPVMLCPSSPIKKAFDGPITTGGFTWSAAGGDYAVFNTLGSSTGANLPPPGTIDIYDTTLLADKTRQYDGVMLVNQIQRFAQITDGLSHTSWLMEDVARTVIHRASKRIGGRTSGGGWADRDNENAVNGTNATGTATSGVCPINCTNVDEIYSFHPGGAMIAVGDGSTRFLSQNISIRVVARLITRAAGDQSPEF